MKALLVLTLLFLSAGCRTVVQVVGARGVPVGGAQVQTVYPSTTGAVSTTDSNGHARLKDSCIDRPLFTTKPEWVRVATPDGTWQFDYPVPSVLRLEDGVPLHQILVPASGPKQTEPVSDQQ